MAKKRGKIVPRSGVRIPKISAPSKREKASSYKPLYYRSGKRHAKGYYVNENTGRVISQRAYYTLKRGGVSHEKLAKNRRERGVPNRSSVANAVLSDYQKSLSLHGIERSRGAIRTSAGYKKMLSFLRSGDRSPGGKMAIALEALGRRPPDATYAVGDTPRLVQRRRRR